ncbi:MAG: FAD-dependent oxidoreductase [Gammaproteobacteria bacterium]|nr:FAD-dependent oxidoreductase [Gammaproteobacteria bacterium]
MKTVYDVVVVGGGVTGLTFAALLAQSANADRLRITLVDAGKRASHATEDGVALRVSAFATGSAELLESVGAWRQIADTRACPYEAMRVWDETDTPDSPSALRFDAAEFAVQQLGFIAENVLVQDALLSVLDATDVDMRFESSMRSMKRVGRQFELAFDNDSLRADLVVAADGARSFVRRCAGIEARSWPYDQDAFVTHLRPEHPHRNTAWQRFLRTGPLGMLPLLDGRISVVWSVPPELAATAKKASEEDLGRMLSDASDRVLGELTVEGPRASFPLCARHAKNYVMPGLALIGDAAHAVHPLAGQGANLGLQDAATLTDTISDALASGMHPGDKPVLRRYERGRKGANATMLHFMTGLNRLFKADSKLLGELRSTGMRLFNRSGPVRERAVKVALGVGRQGGR